MLGTCGLCILPPFGRAPFREQFVRRLPKRVPLIISRLRKENCIVRPWHLHARTNPRLQRQMHLYARTYPLSRRTHESILQVVVRKKYKRNMYKPRPHQKKENLLLLILWSEDSTARQRPERVAVLRARDRGDHRPTPPHGSFTPNTETQAGGGFHLA